MHNRFLGFVAHVRKAEGLALDRAVTGIDDEMMFFAQLFCHRENVDAFVVFHAGERFGAVTILGEEVEAGAADPVVDEGVGADVPGEARFQSLLEDFIELGL